MANRNSNIGFWQSGFPNQLGNLCFVVFLAALAVFLLYAMFDLNVFDPDSFTSTKKARTSQAGEAADRPPAIPELGTRRVVDEAGLLTPPEIDALTKEIDAFEASSGAQMAVLLIRSLNGAPLEDYSLEVANTWAIGRKKESNGVLLLLAVDDHRSRMEIGEGMEAVINDARAGDILRGMAPALRQEQYAQAISYAVRCVDAFVRDEPAPDEPEMQNGPADTLAFVLMLCLLGIVAGTITARVMIHPDVKRSIGLIAMIFLGRLLLEALIAALRNGGRGGSGGSGGGGGSSRSGGGGGHFSGGGASGRW